jgi:exonuclease III
MMKVLSYNARGLGGGEKRREVRRLICEKQPTVVCIQETKMFVLSDNVIKAVWGDHPCGYSYQPSIGASGGLVTVWDSTLVDVWCTMSAGNVLVIKGTIVLTTEDFVIFNVYAPCEAAAKKLLWNHLTSLVLDNSDVRLCVCADFNSVRCMDERKGRGVVFR